MNKPSQIISFDTPSNLEDGRVFCLTLIEVYSSAFDITTKNK